MTIDSTAAKKARGAFFTPPKLAEFMAQWCLRDSKDRVLEPSCGEAAFLNAAAGRLSELGAQGKLEHQLNGIEIHEESARIASKNMDAAGYKAQIQIGNFFDQTSSATYDAVIGNPPYIRYQSFTGEERTKAKEVALKHGVRFDGLANSWAPFLVHAAAFLKPTGRLALVLPGELLSVNYAAPARKFLMERFGRVALVVFQKRVFKEVLEEVVIVLAEGEGPTDHCELYQAEDASDLGNLEPWSWAPSTNSDKWMAALLPTEIASLYGETTANENFSTLHSWGDTDLGMVTGNNKYFTMSAETAAEFKIPERDLLRISPPSSRHLRGLMFGEQSWTEMRKQSARVYLFRPSGSRLSKGAEKYIAHGESLDVQKAYKCRVRKPWWLVPLVKSPDLFLTYMNHTSPRLIANRARVGHLNSVHGVNFHSGVKRIGTDLLPIAALNSLTLLGAELVGRAYGGGMLKLEPREADKLPVPAIACVENISNSLRALRPQLAKSFRKNDLDEVVLMVDKIVLRRGLGLRQHQIDTLRHGRELMFERRAARSGGVE